LINQKTLFITASVYIEKEPAFFGMPVLLQPAKSLRRSFL